MELCIQASRQDQVFRPWVCVNEVGKVGSFVLFVLSTKWAIDAPCFARLTARSVACCHALASNQFDCDACEVGPAQADRPNDKLNKPNTFHYFILRVASDWIHCWCCEFYGFVPDFCTVLRQMHLLYVVKGNS